MDVQRLFKQTRTVGHLVYSQVLWNYKRVLNIFVHEAFVIVPKDALSENKEHDQLTGTLSKATNVTVKLLSQMTTVFVTCSSSK